MPLLLSLLPKSLPLLRRYLPFVAGGVLVLGFVWHYLGVRDDRSDLRDTVRAHEAEIEALERQHAATEAMLKITERTLSELRTSEKRIQQLERNAANAPDEDDGEVAPVLRDAMRGLGGL
jgi:chromosome segregation ATPase